MALENEVATRNYLCDDEDENSNLVLKKVVVQIEQIDRKLHWIISSNQCFRRLLLQTTTDQMKMASLFHCYGKINRSHFIQSGDMRVPLVDILSEIDQIHEIVNYFKSFGAQHQPRRFLVYLEYLENILRERYENLVTKYAEIMAPADLLHPSETVHTNHLDPFSEKLLDVQQFRIIFDYFNEKGSVQNLIDFYGEKKGGPIEKSLQNLKEHLSLSNDHRQSTCQRRSSLINSASKLAAPSNILGRLHNSLSPRRPSSGRRHSMMIPKSPSCSLDNNSCSIKTLLDFNNIGLINSVAQTTDTKNYKFLLDGLVVLLIREMEWISSIFPDEFKHNVFQSVLLTPMNFMQNIANDMCETIQGMTDKMVSDRQHIFGLFGIIQWFYRSKNNLENRFYTANMDLRNAWFKVLLNIFEKSVMNCLHSVLIEVRNDPTPPTSDASVHSLTSNVIEFMSDLINVGHIVDNIEADYRERSRSFNGQQQIAEKSALTLYFAKLLTALRTQLQQKAETYELAENQTKKFVFLMNNTYYLINRIDRSSLVMMLKQTHSDLLLKLVGDHNRYMKEYLKAYTPLMELIRTTLKDDIMKNLTPKRLNQNERNWLKEKSMAINRSIEELQRKLELCHIDEPNLQDKMKNEELKKLFQLFDAYHERFSAAGFSENPQKHLIHTPSTFQSIIYALVDDK